MENINNTFVLRLLKMARDCEIEPNSEDPEYLTPYDIHRRAVKTNQHYRLHINHMEDEGLIKRRHIGASEFKLTQDGRDYLEAWTC